MNAQHATEDLVRVALEGHPQRELSLKGSYRSILVMPRNLSVSTTEEGSSSTPDCGELLKCDLEFQLPPAAYATTFMTGLTTNPHKRGS